MLNWLRRAFGAPRQDVFEQLLPLLVEAIPRVVASHDLPKPICAVRVYYYDTCASCTYLTLRMMSADLRANLVAQHGWNAPYSLWSAGEEERDGDVEFGLTPNGETATHYPKVSRYCGHDVHEYLADTDPRIVHFSKLWSLADLHRGVEGIHVDCATSRQSAWPKLSSTRYLLIANLAAELHNHCTNVIPSNVRHSYPTWSGEEMPAIKTLSPEEYAHLYERARQVLPGGVCSSTRWNSAWQKPVYSQRSHGSRFWDVEGREFLDMSMSHGASLLGHGPACLKQVFEQAWEVGLLGSFDTRFHVELAEALCRIVPCADRVRFTNSGSEATLHALRLCRAASGRDKIIRFHGHFHGYHEFTFIGGHPPHDQLDAVPPFRESAGIPRALAELVITAEYNDVAALESIIKRHKHEAGTLVIEPVDYNCGCILPEPGFLEAARQLTTEHGLLLFFDEIQSFAKKSPGGAQQDFGVTPDICTIGKSLGAGLPLSAICGTAELMDRFKPVGDVAHSGTFNGPLTSVLAGLAFVHQIEQPSFWTTINSLGEAFYPELAAIARRSAVPVRIQHHGSRFGIVFGTREKVTNYRQSLCHSKQRMLNFCQETTNRGVYFHDYGGGACHHGYSLAHSTADLAKVLQVVEDSLARVA